MRLRRPAWGGAVGTDPGMPRFYFHVFDGRAALDTDGTDLASSEAARTEAVRLAGTILRDEAARLAVGEGWHMDVTDQDGSMLFRLDFSISAATVG